MWEVSVLFEKSFCLIEIRGWILIDKYSRSQSIIYLSIPFSHIFQYRSAFLILFVALFHSKHSLLWHINVHAFLGVPSHTDANYFVVVFCCTATHVHSSTLKKNRNTFLMTLILEFTCENIEVVLHGNKETMTIKKKQMEFYISIIQYVYTASISPSFNRKFIIFESALDTFIKTMFCAMRFLLAMFCCTIAWFIK